jgi:glutamate-1-semialdehyde 2,1-aminomutase
MSNKRVNNKNKGFSLWMEAKEIIPGGNSILSKRPERYAGELWPTYFKRSKGCEIWDLDNKKYFDFAQMGIGASILGYSNSELNNYIKKKIDLGISTTLNSFEEFDLAKKLIELNKGFKGVKFARSGGEAMMVAIRIARSLKKNNQEIAFSGYHGWFDWYLATNLQTKKNLNEHLLPGLDTIGVDRKLKGSIYPFGYNNSGELKKLVSKNKKIGIVVVESARYDYPKKKFVQEINKICKANNLILICDEITSGFRISNTGAYKKIGFNPEIVVYGKGLGNGFPITAIVGKKKVMNNAKKSFISSSNWSERIGFAAALKTIEIIEKKKVWIHLDKIGTQIKSGWIKIFKKYNLDINVSNFLPLVTMKLNYGKKNNLILTYFIQEMLKKKYLVSSSVYISFSHTKKSVEKYLIETDKVFKKISKLLKEKKIKKQISINIRSDAFKRL